MLENSAPNAATSRLDLALRKNRGSQIRHDWMSRLSQACGYEVRPEHLLTLEQTDKLKRAFVERLKANQGVVRRNWPKGSLPEMATALRELSIDVRFMPTVLFSSVDQYVGAVELPASVALINFPAVWTVVENDFCLSSADVQSGLCVEVNFYELTGAYCEEGIYEVAGWGAFVPQP